MILRVPTSLLLCAMILSPRLPLGRDYLHSTVKSLAQILQAQHFLRTRGSLAFANGAEEELEGHGNILIWPCLRVLILSLRVLILSWFASALLSLSC